MQKKILLFTFSIVFVVILISLVSASCLTIQTAKQEYLPRETLQAEIDTNNLMSSLSTEDLFLYRDNNLLPTVFFMTKMTSTKYFIWANLPATAGQYTLKVRGTCKEGISFAQSEFTLKSSIYPLYNSIPKDNFKSLDLDTHIWTALANSFIPEIASKAQTDFLARSDSCYNSPCTTKQYALSSMAFPTIRTKMLDMLEDSKNSMNGTWILQIDSPIQQSCEITINNQNNTVQINSGKQNMSLDLTNETTDITIDINCTNETSIVLINQILGEEKIISTQTSKDIAIIIKNEECWGQGIKTTCDEESTDFAVFALKYLGKDISNKTINWIQDNNKLVMTKAMYYFLTKDEETKTWLLGVQMFNGGWPRKLGDYVIDIETSGLTYFALQDSNDIKKTENKLNSIFSTSTSEEKAQILFFIFPASKIEPIMSIWPGMIKTKSQDNFNLILKNEGQDNITASIDFLNSTIPSDLPVGAIKNINILVPKATTPDASSLLLDLKINYTSIYGGVRTYTIPVLLFTEKGEWNIPGIENASQKLINETEEQNLINNSNDTLNNQTGDFNNSLFSKFRFLEGNINKKITDSENLTISLTLENKLSTDLDQVTITTEGSNLIGIIQADPYLIDKIKSGEQKTITLTITPRFNGNFSGTLVAKGKTNNQTISTNISISLDVETTASNITCAEMNGTDCSGTNAKCDGVDQTASDTFHCCIGKCSKGGTSILLPLIIIIVIVIVLVIALFLLKRKPKKEMKDVLEEVQKKYQHRYRDTPEIESLEKEKL